MRYVVWLLVAVAVAGFAVSARRGSGPAGGDSPWSLNDVHIVNDSLAWGVGEDGIIARRIGNDWVLDTVVTSHLGRFANADFTGVFFWDERHGWIIGNGKTDRAHSRKPRPVVLRTIDGGENWEVRFPFVPEGSRLLDIEFGSRYCGRIAAENGYVLLTKDGGVTWHCSFAGHNPDLIDRTWSARTKRR